MATSPSFASFVVAVLSLSCLACSSGNPSPSLFSADTGADAVTADAQQDSTLGDTAPTPEDATLEEISETLDLVLDDVFQGDNQTVDLPDVASDLPDNTEDDAVEDIASDVDPVDVATPCASSKDCGDDEVCNKELGICVGCVVDADCAEYEFCDATGQCVEFVPCDSDKVCKDLMMVCDMEGGKCVECVFDVDCADDRFCLDHVCLDDLCQPGASSCLDGAVWQCAENGGAMELKTQCTLNQYCAEGACHDQVCAPDESYCDGDVLRTCDSVGSGPIAEFTDCEADGLVCISGACLCIPETCGSLGVTCGTWDDACDGELECGTCPENHECQEGTCICVPDCAGKECGDDGCGGSCGECPTTDGFVLVPAGSFWMGSPAGETCPAGYVGGGCSGDGTGTTTPELGRDSDELLHKVTLTRDYEIMELPVTQSQWKAAFNNWNPSAFAQCGGQCPIENISWYSALAYANWKSQQEGLTPCYTFSGVVCANNGSVGSSYMNCMNGSAKGIAAATVGLQQGKASPYACDGFRLPMEAEWEYAARAGTVTPFSDGGGIDGSHDICQVPFHLTDMAWYCANAGNSLKAVGQKAANGIGLKDMSGNVWEWVWDWKGNYVAPYTDPESASAGGNGYRCRRGGGYDSYAKHLRSANRGGGYPGASYPTDGFRLVRTLP